MDDMISDFYIEADELYAEAEDGLLALEKNEDFNSNFNSVFRSFHSIKGASGMFGLDELQEHMHFLENLLEKRKDKNELSNNFIDYLLSGIDTAKKIMNNEDVSFKYFDPDTSECNNNKIIDTSLKTNIKESADIRIKQNSLSGHIFIVDDEPDILDITKTILEDQDYQVSEFLSAKDALDALKKTTPDTIITDINMPEMDGIEFMHLVNKEKPHIPVIIASGHVTKEACLDALSGGVSGILEKPFSLNSLLNSVNISVQKYRAFKLLNKSLDLIVYQFEDFDTFLQEKGSTQKRETIREELRTILKQKKILNESVKSD